jgi:two-component system, OmpR family, response regulator ChvI
MQTIAVIEDSAAEAKFIRDALEESEFKVVPFADGTSALDALRHDHVDLAILDLKLPDMDGTELLQRLRMHSDLPVIILTAVWTEEIDQIVGFRQGADDYIIKPASRHILVERVKTVLRRANGERRDALPSSVYEWGPLRMDQERYACSWKGEALTLSRSCFEITWALARASGKIMSRDELSRSGYVGSVDDSISIIKKEFKRVDSTFEGIQAFRGVGWAFVQ